MFGVIFYVVCGLVGAWLTYYFFKINTYLFKTKYKSLYPKYEWTWCPTPFQILGFLFFVALGYFGLFLSVIWSLMVYFDEDNRAYFKRSGNVTKSFATVICNILEWANKPICK